MTLGKLLNILSLVTLIEGMVFVGLQASINDVISAARDWKLVVRMLLAMRLYIVFKESGNQVRQDSSSTMAISLAIFDKLSFSSSSDVILGDKGV